MAVALGTAAAGFVGWELIKQGAIKIAGQIVFLGATNVVFSLSDTLYDLWVYEAKVKIMKQTHHYELTKKLEGVEKSHTTFIARVLQYDRVDPITFEQYAKILVKLPPKQMIEKIEWDLLHLQLELQQANLKWDESSFFVHTLNALMVSRNTGKEVVLRFTNEQNRNATPEDYAELIRSANTVHAVQLKTDVDPTDVCYDYFMTLSRYMRLGFVVDAKHPETLRLLEFIINPMFQDGVLLCNGKYFVRETTPMYEIDDVVTMNNFFQIVKYGSAGAALGSFVVYVIENREEIKKKKSQFHALMNKRDEVKQQGKHFLAIPYQWTPSITGTFQNKQQTLDLMPLKRQRRASRMQKQQPRLSITDATRTTIDEELFTPLVFAEKQQLLTNTSPGFVVVEDEVTPVSQKLADAVFVDDETGQKLPTVTSVEEAEQKLKKQQEKPGGQREEMIRKINYIRNKMQGKSQPIIPEYDKEYDEKQDITKLFKAPHAATIVNLLRGEKNSDEDVILQLENIMKVSFDEAATSPPATAPATAPVPVQSPVYLASMPIINTNKTIFEAIQYMQSGEDPALNAAFARVFIPVYKRREEGISLYKELPGIKFKTGVNLQQRVDRILELAMQISNVETYRLTSTLTQQNSDELSRRDNFQQYVNETVRLVNNYYNDKQKESGSERRTVATWPNLG